MAKYMIQGTYSVDGIKGLAADKASGRKAAVAKACESLGGKLDAMYYMFGDEDILAILDLPDNASAAGFSFAVAAAGLARVRTTPLLTIEETDAALAKSPAYRAPGR